MVSLSRLSRVGYVLGLSIALAVLAWPSRSEGQLRGTLPPAPQMPRLDNQLTDSTGGFASMGIGGGAGGLGTMSGGMSGGMRRHAGMSGMMHGRRHDGRRHDGRHEHGRRHDGRRHDGRRHDGRRHDGHAAA